MYINKRLYNTAHMCTHLSVKKVHAPSGIRTWGLPYSTWQLFRRMLDRSATTSD